MIGLLKVLLLSSCVPIGIAPISVGVDFDKNANNKNKEKPNFYFEKDTNTINYVFNQSANEEWGIAWLADIKKGCNTIDLGEIIKLSDYYLYSTFDSQINKYFEKINISSNLKFNNLNLYGNDGEYGNSGHHDHNNIVNSDTFFQEKYSYFYTNNGKQPNKNNTNSSCYNHFSEIISDISPIDIILNNSNLSILTLINNNINNKYNYIEYCIHLKGWSDHDSGIFNYYPKFSFSNDDGSIKLSFIFSYYLRDHVSTATYWRVTLYFGLNGYDTYQFTLPYSTQQIYYDLVENKDRPIPAKISVYTDSDLNNLWSNAINQANIKNQCETIKKNMLDYIDNSYDFKKMGISSNDVSLYIDYSDLINNKNNVYFKLNLDNIKHLIPIKKDIIEKVGNGFNNVSWNESTSQLIFSSKVVLKPSDKYNPANEAIKNLLKITPYGTVSQNLSYFDRKKEFNDLYILKSDNLRLINSNPYNINYQDCLVTYNNILFIQKYGLDLLFNFELKVRDPNNNEYIYNFDNLKTEKIYNYGHYSLNLDCNHVINNIIKNNVIKIDIEFSQNGIFVSDYQYLNQLTEFGYDVQLKLKSVCATVSNEQDYQPAKWTLVSNQAPDNEFETNPYDYYGTYSTGSPFIIYLKNSYIVSASNNNTIIAKYKLFINDVEITSDPNEGIKFDTAQFFRDALNGQNQDPNLNIKIRVKEYDPNSPGEQDKDKYNKLVFGLDVNMNIFTNANNFQLNGWDDPSLEIEKEQYFSEDSDKYREFADENTGMYIPKVVWVNSVAQNGFKYDPLDENGELLDGVGVESANIDFAAGYIAEINASSFRAGDFSSSQLTGNYNISYDSTKVDYESKIPTVYEYQFSNNYYTKPKINESLLLPGTTLQINSNNLTQTVLKRKDNNSYSYQFCIYNPDFINSEGKQKPILDLYNNYVDMNHEPLFVDFWDTYHGANLLKYIQKSQPDFALDSAKELSYLETLSYWDSYIFNYTSQVDELLSLNSFSHSPIAINYANFEDVKRIVINKIDSILTKWYRANKSNDILYLGNDENSDYIIDDYVGNEVSSPKFDQKIQQLVDNYRNGNNDSISFNIYANSESIKISGQTIINFFNTSQGDDLSKLNTKPILFNSNFVGDIANNKPSFDDKYPGLNKVEKIKNLIYSKIDNRINSFFNKNEPYKLDVDYELEFYKDKNCSELIDNIDLASRYLLSYESDPEIFDNTIYVKIIAKNSNQVSKKTDPNVHLLLGESVQTFNNTSNLNDADDEIEADNNSNESVTESSQDWIWILSVTTASVILIATIITILVLRHKRKKL